MADGKYVLKKLQEILEADATLQAMQTGGIKARIARFNPVGNAYPQICLWIDEGKSECIFPAGHYRLEITVWVDKTETEPYKKIKNISGRINALVNRKASSLSEINVALDTGLRVANCLKDGGEIDFDKQTEKYYNETHYKCVISEGESFIAANAGNRAWQ